MAHMDLGHFPPEIQEKILNKRILEHPGILWSLERLKKT